MKPWFMQVDKQRRVMNRIADHTPHHQLRQVLDQATQRLWDKVDQFYARARIIQP